MSEPQPSLPPSPLDVWPPDWEPAAVVFDCDGVLVDTESEWVALQTDYLAEHGVVLDDGVRRRIIGGSAEVVIRAIADEVGRPPEHVMTELMDRHRTAVHRELVPMPGVRETLTAISAVKPLAVASNSPRDLLDRKLDALGLRPLLDATVAIEDVAEPKPAPDMYRTAADLLGAEPAESLGVEDSETGARAAVGAGLQVIGVPSLPGQRPVVPRLLDSLEDPGLQRWIATWTRTR